MSNPVAWFEIYVDDMNRARRFYESVFKAKLEKLDAPFPGIELWAFPGDRTSYGVSGALVKMDGFSAGGSGTIVYFHSEDCAVEEGRVAASGGQVQQSKKSIGQYGFISLVHDTEGNLFGLHSMK